MAPLLLSCLTWLHSPKVERVVKGYGANDRMMVEGALGTIFDAKVVTRAKGRSNKLGQRPDQQDRRGSVGLDSHRNEWNRDEVEGYPQPIEISEGGDDSPPA
jgi:hypothetical protein